MKLLVTRVIVETFEVGDDFSYFISDEPEKAEAHLFDLRAAGKYKLLRDSEQYIIDPDNFKTVQEVGECD